MWKNVKGAGDDGHHLHDDDDGDLYDGDDDDDEDDDDDDDGDDDGHLTLHHVLLQLWHHCIAAVTKEDRVPMSNNDFAHILNEHVFTTLHTEALP